MSNEKLEEAIAKAIFVGILYGGNSAEWEEQNKDKWDFRGAWNIARDVLLCPELIAALAPPAPHIVDTVEGLEGLPEDSIVLDDDGSAWTRLRDILWRHGRGYLTSAELLEIWGPFTVLHVGGAE